MIIFVGRVVESSEGRDFVSPKVCVSILVGWGCIIQLPYNLNVLGLDEAD